MLHHTQRCDDSAQKECGGSRSNELYILRPESGNISYFVSPKFMTFPSNVSQFQATGETTTSLPSKAWEERQQGLSASPSHLHCQTVVSSATSYHVMHKLSYVHFICLFLSLFACSLLFDILLLVFLTVCFTSSFRCESISCGFLCTLTEFWSMGSTQLSC